MLQVKGNYCSDSANASSTGMRGYTIQIRSLVVQASRVSREFFNKKKSTIYPRIRRKNVRRTVSHTLLPHSVTFSLPSTPELAVEVGKVKHQTINARIKSRVGMRMYTNPDGTPRA